MHSVTVNKQVTIKASARQVFAFISKPQNMTIVIPHILRNYNITKGPIKPGWKFNWEIVMMGIPFRGTWIIDEYAPPCTYVSHTTGISSEWVYKLTEKNKATLVRLTVTYFLPKIILAKFAKPVVRAVNEKDIERFLTNLKIVLESSKAR